jgi:two-component system, NarL family, nitrate/nitrite response regulator NarL
VMHPQTVIREGIRTLLTRTEQFRVIAEAATHQDAVRQFRQLSPDLALVNLSADGVRVGADLASTVSVLFVTMDRPRTELLLQALDLPIKGCVSLDQADEFVYGCEAVMREQQTFVTPRWALPLLRDVRRQNSSARLTDRERDILMALLAGASIQVISTQYSLAQSTVKNHLGRIYQKMGVKNRREAVAKMAGWIS